MLSALTWWLKESHSITGPSITVVNFHIMNCGCCKNNGNFAKADFANRLVLNWSHLFIGTAGCYPHVLFLLSGITTMPMMLITWGMGAFSLVLTPGWGATR